MRNIWGVEPKVSKEDNIDSVAFPIDSNPFGISFADWTSKWWQWLLSIPKDKNPASDKSTKCFEETQEGPVWFFASTTEDVGQVVRRCTIPENKALLLPILNYGATFADEPTIKSDEELNSLAISEMDKITNLSVILDDSKLIDIAKYRVHSPMFDVILPTSNITNGTPGPTRGTGNGYWLFLKPLPKGSHVIETVGSCRAGTVTIKARYEITVTQ